MLVRLENAYEDQRRFVADASHELRTPVAVIRGNVELLRSGRMSSAEAEESLGMIEGESVRMARLLDELLSLARLEEPGRLKFQPMEATRRSTGSSRPSGREISGAVRCGSRQSGPADRRS
jgi:signal transduction histidine kinase